jgi:nitrite reductase (NADH) small subunit
MEGAGRGSQATGRWIAICALDTIIPNTGVGALVEGRQIAVFRLGPGAEVYALQNFDPFSKAFVLSRGILGDRGGVPKVASPIFKQSFDLRTGRCLDDPAVAVRAYPARVVDGRVEVLFEPGTAGRTP